MVRSEESLVNGAETRVMSFIIPDIHVVSPPCGPGDVSGGGLAA